MFILAVYFAPTGIVGKLANLPMTADVLGRDSAVRRQLPHSLAIETAGSAKLRTDSRD